MTTGHSWTSVDTLQLLFDFEFDDLFLPAFKVVPAPPGKQTSLLWVKRKAEQGGGLRATKTATVKELASLPIGSEVKGHLAWARAGGFLFRIRRLWPGEPPKLTVSFSLPRFKWGNNSFPASRQDLERALLEMVEVGATIGVHFDSSQGKITALHLMRDVELIRPVSLYWPILKQVPVRYGRVVRNYETGMYRGSKRSAWVCYEKIRELEKRVNRHNPEARYALDELASKGIKCLLRLEWRLTCAKTIREKLGLRSVADLVAYYDKCGDWLSTALKRDVFSLTVPSEEELACWRQARQTHGDGLRYKLDTGHRVADVLAYERFRDGLAEVGAVESDWEGMLRGASKPGEWTRLKEKMLLLRMRDQVTPDWLWGELYGELRAIALASGTSSGTENAESLGTAVPLPGPSSVQDQDLAA